MNSIIKGVKKRNLRFTDGDEHMQLVVEYLFSGRKKAATETERRLVLSPDGAVKLFPVYYFFK